VKGGKEWLLYLLSLLLLRVINSFAILSKSSRPSRKRGKRRGKKRGKGRRGKEGESF